MSHTKSTCSCYIPNLWTIPMSHTKSTFSCYIPNLWTIPMSHTKSLDRRTRCVCVHACHGHRVHACVRACACIHACARVCICACMNACIRTRACVKTWMDGQYSRDGHGSNQAYCECWSHEPAEAPRYTIGEWNPCLHTTCTSIQRANPSQTNNNMPIRAAERRLRTARLSCSVSRQ